MKKLFIITALLSIMASCGSPENEEKDEKPKEEALTEVELNAPAEGFNVEESDAVAIITADKVMKAMGGRQAWDDTRYISWNFLGMRDLWWDKQTGNVRIESPNQDLTILMNVNDMSGQVMKSGQEVSDDSLDYYLDMGKKIWINDSYWLVMPFKLKDSGVTLKYAGEDTTMAGEKADILQLTFEDVGITPQNKYQVWVSSEDDLIKQWAYYGAATDTVPAFVLPWTAYEKKGGILLSGERGDRDLENIEVAEDLPESIFTDFDGAIQ